MTVRTRALLKSDADSLIPDNAAGEASPEDVRERVKDLADSALFPEDAGSGILALQRQNDLLALATLSKLAVGYQRQLGLYANGYKASDGIDAAGSSNYVLDTVVGCVKPTFTTTGGNDTNTVLLLHGDGADASTTFTDSSSGAKTVTRTGNPEIDTAQSKFGGASMLIANSGGSNYLSLADHADWKFGTGDFTIDGWIRVSSFVGGSSYWTLADVGSYGAGVAIYGSNINMTVYVNNTPNNRTIALSTGVWYHIAVTRSGTSLRIFLDGVQLGATETNSANLVSTSGVRIGQDITDANVRFNGWIDELRISKGIARWTANFTPPSVAYDASGTYGNVTVKEIDQTVDSTGRIFGVYDVHPVDAMTIGTTFIVEVYANSIWNACTLTNAGTTEGGRTVVAYSASGLTAFTTAKVRFRTATNKDHRVYRSAYDARATA